MKFGDKSFKETLKEAEREKHCSGSFYPMVEALLCAHERVLTLEAEIKALVDGAGKDRAEIERLRQDLDHCESYTGNAVKLREELKLSESRRGELVHALTVLFREVKGTLKAHELAIRYDSGNSNWNCLEIALSGAEQTLASQPRPKILDVVDASKELNDILNDPEARKQIDSFTGQPLKIALAAMEKE